MAKETIYIVLTEQKTIAGIVKSPGYILFGHVEVAKIKDKEAEGS